MTICFSDRETMISYDQSLSYVFFMMKKVMYAAFRAGSSVRNADDAGSFSSDAGAKAEKYLSDFGDAMMRLAYSYVHNMYDAEDILQEALIKTLLADPSFKSEAHIKNYLMKVTANLSKNLLKKNKNRLRRADELQQELVMAQQDIGEGSLYDLWQAVKKLPVPQREAVHLFYEEGCSTKEIASILGRKEPTVRSDLRRARKKLKKLLEDGGMKGPDIPEGTDK